jgi:hypothetical protein
LGRTAIIPSAAEVLKLKGFQVENEPPHVVFGPSTTGTLVMNSTGNIRAIRPSVWWVPCDNQRHTNRAHRNGACEDVHRQHFPLWAAARGHALAKLEVADSWGLVHQHRNVDHSQAPLGTRTSHSRASGNRAEGAARICDQAHATLLVTGCTQPRRLYKRSATGSLGDGPE